MDNPKKISDMPEYLTPQDNEVIKGSNWSLSIDVLCKSPAEMSDKELLEFYRELLVAMQKFEYEIDRRTPNWRTKKLEELTQRIKNFEESING